VYDLWPKKAVVPSLLFLDASEEPIEIGEVRHVAHRACGIFTDRLHGRLQFLFAAAGHEDVCTLGDRPLGRRKADAAVAASDERYFSVTLPEVQALNNK
jgi:hypothetical protein